MNFFPFVHYIIVHWCNIWFPTACSSYKLKPFHIFSTNGHHSMFRDGLIKVLKIGFLHKASITNNGDILLNHYSKSRINLLRI